MVAASAVIVILGAAVGIGAVLYSRSFSSTSSMTSSTASSTTQPTSSTTTFTTNQTSLSITTSSSVVLTSCAFSSPPPLNASGSISVPPFMGCLTSGATGVYQIAVTDPNGTLLAGGIRSQYPINMTMVGAQVDNLTAAGHGGVTLSAQNATTVGFRNILLSGKTGYVINVTNLSNQNNTVTFIFIIVDQVSLEVG